MNKLETLDPPTVKKIVAEIMINYMVLRNHLDEVDDVYQRGMIDRDFYLSRQSHVITSGVAMLCGFAEFSSTSADDAAFLARLDKVAQDYELKKKGNPDP